MIVGSTEVRNRRSRSGCKDASERLDGLGVGPPRSRSRLRSLPASWVAGVNWYFRSRSTRSARWSVVSCRRRFGFITAATASKSSTWNTTLTPSSPSCTTRTHGRAANRLATGPRFVGARSEVVAAVRVDVAVSARDRQQPGIVKAAAVTAFGLVAFVI